MKKIVSGLLIGAFILGGATFTSAATNGGGEGLLNFGQMKPYIEQMHPELSIKEQKEMFDACHEENSPMQNDNMMNTL